MTKHSEKELVTYHFVMNIGFDRHEVSGTKTLKLFRAWFKLAANWHYPYTPKSARRTLLFGTVKFSDGETWIWQNKKITSPGGWRLVKTPDSIQISLF